VPFVREPIAPYAIADARGPANTARVS
jgi:hypothetical protein